jgi:ABC-type transport system involved in cytochrome bd biosynthesis fused ATPase/permease subunit
MMPPPPAAAAVQPAPQVQANVDHIVADLRHSFADVLKTVSGLQRVQKEQQDHIRRVEREQEAIRERQERQDRVLALLKQAQDIMNQR